MSPHKLFLSLQQGLMKKPIDVVKFLDALHLVYINCIQKRRRTPCSPSHFVLFFHMRFIWQNHAFQLMTLPRASTFAQDLNTRLIIFFMEKPPIFSRFHPGSDDMITITQHKFHVNTAKRRSFLKKFLYFRAFKPINRSMRCGSSVQAFCRTKLIPSAVLTS